MKDLIQAHKRLISTVKEQMGFSDYGMYWLAFIEGGLTIWLFESSFFVGASKKFEVSFHRYQLLAASKIKPNNCIYLIFLTSYNYLIRIDIGEIIKNKN